MSHWNDDQFAAALLGETAADDAHLQACAPCRNELLRLRAGVSGMKQDAEAAGEQTEIFWQRQRAAIRAQLAGRARRPSGWAWAAAVAAVLWLAIALNQPAPPTEPIAHQDPDHVLLMEVEQSLRREVPRALAPAELLTQELDRAVGSQRNP